MRSIVQAAESQAKPATQLTPSALLPRIPALVLMLLFIPTVITTATEDDEASKGYLGIHMRRLTKDIRKSFDVKVKDGVLVSYVEQDSPAEEAGIIDGDVIVKYDQQRVDSPDDLRARVRDTEPGERVKVTLIRDGNEKTVEAIIGERPEEDFAFTLPDDWTLHWEGGLAPHFESGGIFITSGNVLGVKVTELNEELAPYFDVDKDKGVLVIGVFPNTVAKDAGILAGDVITKIGDETVASIEALREAVRKHDPGDQFTISIVRQGKKKVLDAEMKKSKRVRIFGPRMIPHGHWEVPSETWIPGSVEDNLREELDQLRKEVDDLRDRLHDMRGND
jgi:predicted metalloprotease with PDZ domain